MEFLINKFVSLIVASQILDSRGIPTVKASIHCDSPSIKVSASVPSGASTGSREALELRDNVSNFFFNCSVVNAINNINQKIYPYLLEQDISCTNQALIDHFLIKLDGTSNKSNLGANSILAVSMAFAKLGASLSNQSLYRYLGGVSSVVLPIPMMNILNGGAHASNNIDFQEFMIVPIGFNSYSSALQAGVEIYNTLKKELKSKNHSTLIGDEGGFAPNLTSITEALELIIYVIRKAGYEAKSSGPNSVAIALDVAANEFCTNNNEKNSEFIYFLKKASKSDINNNKEKYFFTSTQLLKFYDNIIEKYPIISIEDPFSENDWKGFQSLTKKHGNKIQIVGDDIFTTNLKYLKKGCEEKIANSILIKLNQIGTVSETIDVVKYAQKRSWTTIISHRSGETSDTFIADLAVALNTGFIKTGAPCRSERNAKYNRLLEIEQELDINAVYLGKQAFYNLFEF